MEMELGGASGGMWDPDFSERGKGACTFSHKRVHLYPVDGVWRWSLIQLDAKWRPQKSFILVPSLRKIRNNEIQVGLQRKNINCWSEFEKMRGLEGAEPSQMLYI